LNTIDNMTLMSGAGLPGLTQSTAGSGGAQGLLDFLSLILAQPGQLMQMPGAGTEQTDLSAKIAALLKNNPGLQNNSLVQALLKLVQPQGAAQAAGQMPALPPGLTQDDILKKLAELIQQAAPQGAPEPAKPATLTSDLTMNAAPVLQASSSTPADDIRAQIETLLAQNDTAPAPEKDKKIAQLLALLEPQAGAEAAPAPVKIDPQILKELQEKLAEAAPEGVPDKETFARMKESFIHFLKDKGLDAPAIQKYMAALRHSLGKGNVQQDAAAEGSMPSLPQTIIAAPVAVPAPAPQPEKPRTDASAPQQPLAPIQLAPVRQEESAPQAPQQPRQQAQQQTQPQPQAQTGQPETQPQQQAAQKSGQPQQPEAQQPQAPQQQTQAAPAPRPAPVHASIVNAIASGDKGFADFGADTGEQSFGQLLGQQQDAGGVAALLKAPSGSPGSFVNYLDAARGQQSPTVQMVSMQLQTNAMQRIEAMTLRLDPADLGRLDIKMKFDKDGGVKAHLTADKPETLALLQRDSSHLQRALQQAGFDADETNISFDLRQQGQDLGQARDQGGGQQNGYPRDAGPGVNDNNTLQASIAVQAYGTVSQGGVNIMV
jgi:flagellar hook-length control protein FliK